MIPLPAASAWKLVGNGNTPDVLNQKTWMESKFLNRFPRCFCCLLKFDSHCPRVCSKLMPFIHIVWCWFWKPFGRIKKMVILKSLTVTVPKNRHSMYLCRKKYGLYSVVKSLDGKYIEKLINKGTRERRQVTWNWTAISLADLSTAWIEVKDL